MVRIRKEMLDESQPVGTFKKVWFEDKRISCKEWGILGFLVWHPEGISKAALIRSHKGGRFSTESGLRKLQSAGYIEIV